MSDSSTCGAILVVIDGCRPDGIQQADTPNIDSLIARGAYTFNAQSVVPSSTLPCHTSMFRGVTPARHGITTKFLSSNPRFRDKESGGERLGGVREVWESRVGRRQAWF